MPEYVYRVQSGELIPLGDWSAVDPDDALDLEEGAQLWAGRWIAAAVTVALGLFLALLALGIARGLRRTGGL